MYYLNRIQGKGNFFICNRINITFLSIFSGHITYDSQQSRFHSEIQNKTQRYFFSTIPLTFFLIFILSYRLEKLLKTGQLVPKRDRNPLRAERSPRNSNNNFDCSIPNAPKEEIVKKF